VLCSRISLIKRPPSLRRSVEEGVLLIAAPHAFAVSVQVPKQLALACLSASGNCIIAAHAQHCHKYDVKWMRGQCGCGLPLPSASSAALSWLTKTTGHLEQETRTSTFFMRPRLCVHHGQAKPLGNSHAIIINYNSAQMAQLSHDKASLQSGLSRHCALLGHTSVRFDLSHDTVPPPQPSTTAAAAAQGNIKKVQKFVKKGFSVEKKNEYGESLLHVAALSKVGHTPTPAPEHVQQCFSLH
jgi:hypothetical protein